MIFGGGRKVELVGGGGSGVMSSPSSSSSSSSSSATLAAVAASAFKTSTNASLGTTAATVAAAFGSLSTSSFASPSASYSASPQLIKREKRDTYGSYFTQQQQQRHGGHGAPQLSPLLMYSSEHRPHGQLEFDEFAQLALERFAVLQLFENVAARHMRGSNDYIQKLEKELHALGFIKSVLCGVCVAAFISLLYFLLTLLLLLLLYGNKTGKGRHRRGRPRQGLALAFHPSTCVLSNVCSFLFH